MLGVIINLIVSCKFIRIIIIIQLKVATKLMCTAVVTFSQKTTKLLIILCVWSFMNITICTYIFHYTNFFFIIYFKSFFIYSEHSQKIICSSAVVLLHFIYFELINCFIFFQKVLMNDEETHAKDGK